MKKYLPLTFRKEVEALLTVVVEKENQRGPKTIEFVLGPGPKRSLG
jgi:hypothetical protein